VKINKEIESTVMKIKEFEKTKNERDEYIDSIGNIDHKVNLLYQSFYKKNE
jgi:hypothetical protein